MQDRGVVRPGARTHTVFGWGWSALAILIWACGTTPEPKATTGALAGHTEVTDPGSGAVAAPEVEEEAAAQH